MAKKERTRKVSVDIVFNLEEKAWFIEIYYADEPENKMTIGGPYATQAEAARICAGLADVELP